MKTFTVPPGYHFRPTEAELIIGYLKKKVPGQPLPLALSQCVIERNIYDGAPWDVFNDQDPWETIISENKSTGKTKTENIIYVVSPLKKASKNRVSRIAGCGTWDSQTGVVEVKNEKDEVIGFKRMLVFEIKDNKKIDNADFKKGHWIMHEYSMAIPGQQQEGEKVTYVVCQIKCDDSKCLKRVRNSSDQAHKEEPKSDHKRTCYDAATQYTMNQGGCELENHTVFQPVVESNQSPNITGFINDPMTYPILGNNAVIWRQPQNQSEGATVVENRESNSGEWAWLDEPFVDSEDLSLFDDHFSDSMDWSFLGEN